MTENNNITNILFCGTGGQGVLTAAEVCGWAAIFDGYHVKKSEVHGIDQRGGSVESHMRFGREVYSPLIPKGRVDYLVSFNRDETARLKDFLKTDGVDLTGYLARVNTDVADKRYANTFLLGVLSKSLIIQEASWIKAIELVLARKDPKKNKEVFFQGRGCVL